MRAAALLAVLIAGAAQTPPDGRLIVSQERCSPCLTGLTAVEAAGGGARRLTRRAGWHDVGADVAPDGRRIAFARTTDGMRTWAIWVARRDASRARRITRGRFAERPAWSPDGRLIAYAGGSGIRTVRPDGSRDRGVIENAGDPAWSPDGRRLAFSRRGVVWTATAEGRGLRRVAKGRDPDWSPDGGRIVYTRPRDGIAVAPAAGGGSRYLGPGLAPAWSPDGDWIAYARWPAGKPMSVWRMRADGSAARLVLRRAADPAWTP